MRAVVQRVSEASVSISGAVRGEIGVGYLVLLGITNEDSESDVEWLAKKICDLRIFSDDEGKMNLDIRQVDGQVLLISQFTLHAKTKKGTRPSFIRAARPEVAQPLYEQMAAKVEDYLSRPTVCGEFGADMQVHLINDGPVTIVIDTHQKE